MVENIYAQALFELAREEKISDRVVQEMKTVESLFAENQDYVRLLANPAIPVRDRVETLRAAFDGRLHPTVTHFLMLLTEKGRISHFSGIVRAFVRLYNDACGIADVTAVTAVALSPQLAERLREKAQRLTGKTVRLKNVVDPSMLGGVILRWDDTQVDASVKRRLQDLRRQIGQTVIGSES